MKKSTVTPSIRISCRYDSEIFGVFQPMIGWKYVDQVLRNNPRCRCGVKNKLKMRIYYA